MSCGGKLIVAKVGHDDREEGSVKLRNWFLTGHEGTYTAHGYVEGNPRFRDGTFIYTSEVQSILEDGEDWITIQTKNSVYRCAWEECNFNRQEPMEKLRRFPEALRKIQTFPEGLPQECIFLAFSSDDEYFFRRGAVRTRNGTSWLVLFPHLGMFQDSCILMEQEGMAVSRIDIRYFPFPAFLGMEFYQFETDGLTVFLRNEGKKSMRFRLEEETLELRPGESAAFSSFSLEP